MTRRRVSIKDIARVAGVSHATVSRALNDNPRIHPDTRAEIRRIATEMGYTPNSLARSLQSQRSRTIGLVVTSIADPFFGDVVEGIESVAREAGLHVFINLSHNDPERELEVIQSFQSRRVEGIVVATSQLTAEHSERLDEIHVPVVLVNSQGETGRRYRTVAVDDEAGAHLAVEHLIALGHRRIGYVGVEDRSRSNRRRRRGYEQTMAAAGLEVEPTWIRSGTPVEPPPEGDVQLGESHGSALVEMGLEAIFCYNDQVAVGALLAARALGVAVPERLGVVGFDNLSLARYISPPLTTIHQPKRKLGRNAMEMLLALLEGEQVHDRVLEPSLVVRASTAARKVA